MCGICGILGSGLLRGEKRESFVKEMMSLLRHRGPDGEGYVGGERFSLGHRRLAIIDLDRGVQPMVSEEGRYLITYNGEIYNYVELREQLKRNGISFQTNSDTEVLLKILIHQGEAALEQLNGMFAFVFYDTQTGKWIAARDSFGIKPFYYAELEGEFVFASEIKAILAHPHIQAEVDWNAIGEYLTFQFCLRGETLFKGIQVLGPGHYLTGEGGKIEKKVCYWDLNYEVDEHHTVEYFHDQLKYLLEDSARLQVRSDVPLGSYLSGGIDSSFVTMLAARQVDQDMPVFHGRFAEGTAYDESKYAKVVAKEIQGVYCEVVPTAQEFVEHLPELIYYLDEPVAGPGLFPQYIVSKMASEQVKVILGGQGGDEIFAGYARYLVGYLEQALKGGIYETQEEGQHLVTLSSIIPNLPLLRQYKPLMQHFWKEGLFAEMDQRYFRLVDRSPDIEKILTKEALEKFNRNVVFEEFQKVFNHPKTKSYVNKMTHFDQKTLLAALLQVEDRVSMAVSLESRVPLLDTRIVDLVTTMPPPMKFQGGKTKYILKEVAKEFLPELVLNRKDKMGFPVPLVEWMQQGLVRDFVHDVLFSKVCRERGLFDQNALRQLVDKEMRFGRQLWGALCIELWHQRFIDR